MKKLTNIFKHNFNNGDFKLFDKYHHIVYYENKKGHCYKNIYDKNKIIYHENSSNYWCKKEYNNHNDIICFIDSYQSWIEFEYDKFNNIKQIRNDAYLYF